MRKLLSTKYSAGAFSFAMLVLRLVFGGILMVKHGYGKLANFSKTVEDAPNLLHLGKTATASLEIFAEFFCSFLVLIGLFTRLACVPLIIFMVYALAMFHNGHIFSDGESATLYLGVFAVLLFIGPGKASVDGLIGK